MGNAPQAYVMAKGRWSRQMEQNKKVIGLIINSENEIIHTYNQLIIIYKI